MARPGEAWLGKTRTFEIPFCFLPRGSKKVIESARNLRGKMKMTEASRIPTAAQVLDQQRKDHGVVVPLTTAAPAAINAGLGYLAKHTSSGTVVRFSKDGKFIQPTQGDAELAEGTELVCHWDQARAGFQRFNGKGERPDVKIDLIFGGKPPERSELGDDDESQWPISDLSGKPEDPWREVQMVPLESIETGEIFIFQTMSVTGLRAVANLLRQSSRMAAKAPDELPVIKLRAGGFDHHKFGWVRVPAFEFVGKAPKTNIAAAVTAVSADLNDEIPF
jgi:hypothetical protein